MLVILSFLLLSFIDLSEQEVKDQEGLCADGNLRFASYYGDHMVLQRSPEKAGLWGCGPLGAEVTVSVLGPTTQKTKPAKASNETGMWRVTLDPVEPGGPYNITAALTNSTNTSVTLADVLFGDVWLCSGQSNMQFEVFKVFNASEELALASKYPDVRFFMVALKDSEVELPDLIDITIPWSVPNKKDLASFSAVCWLFGRYLYDTLQYPIGLVESCWGGSSIEAWSSLNALTKCGLEEMDREEIELNYRGPKENSILWNSMIHPLLSMTIKGAIWYQGEANAAYHKDSYNCSFPAMIDDWRAAFHKGSENQTAIRFPFGFVQLCTYQQDSVDDGFPEIRWHQTADYGYVPNFRMKNTFMAVAVDLPDKASPYGAQVSFMCIKCFELHFDDFIKNIKLYHFRIHPRDKQDVAYRLTLGAKAVAYNQVLTFNGPFPFLIVVNTDVYIVFDQPLSVTPSDHIFEICCSVNGSLCMPQSSWVSAAITEWKEDTVWLSRDMCPGPGVVSAVRYAWRDWPCEFKACPLYSSNTALPVPPFVINFASTSGWKRNYAADPFLDTGDVPEVQDDLL